MRPEHWLYTIPLRLRSIFRGPQVDQELDEELQVHLEQLIAQEMAAGKPEREARQAALRAMDGLQQRKEECRDRRRIDVIDTLQRDLRQAVRALARTPGFTAVAVITLALGIGANSAIFTLVNTIFLKLLPVEAPEQLCVVGSHPQQLRLSWNYPDYRAMRDRNTVFSGLAAYSLGLQQIGLQTGGSDTSELAHGILVSGNYFDVLGVAPALGRLFNSSEDRAPGASPYVVLSDAYWHAQFRGDSNVIGRKLLLDGYPFVVIGVAPRGFTGTDVALKPDLFVPIMMRSELMHQPFERWNTRHAFWMASIGRLKRGVTIAKAEGELYAICKDQDASERSTAPDPKRVGASERIVLLPGGRGYSGFANNLKKPLLVLFVIVGLVLLIACANVANLMLARGAARQREIAVRLALGASRWRVASQSLVESILIAILGGLGAILVSAAGARVLLNFVPQPAYMRITFSGSPDLRVLVFGIATCLLTVLLFGVGPAFQSSRPDLLPVLKEDAPGSAGGGRFSLRKALVVVQVALSLPLLAGAGLFARTLVNLRSLDTGFAQDSVSVAYVDPTRFGYKGQHARDFYEGLRARAAVLPGVRSASLAAITPLGGSMWNTYVAVEGYTWKPGEEKLAFMNAVSARYFETLGTPVILGREFVDEDNPVATMVIPDRMVPGQGIPQPPGRRVAIVNQAFAKHFFGDRNPLGMHIALDEKYRADKLFEVVGVVKDARYFNMRKAVDPMMFLPIWREPPQPTGLVIRTSGPTSQLATLLRREIRELDPVVPLLNLRTLEQEVNQSILAERLVATLSGFFGGLALLLSAVGLYGVVAYAVTRRTREIGIRIAIGSPRGAVLWLVIREALKMVLIGAIIGLVGAFAAMRAVQTFLYGVSAQDPLSLILAALVLAGAALLASLLPARRAASVDPVIALRYE